MLFTRKSILTGKTRSRNIPCTEQQAASIHQGWLIRRAIPDISNDDYAFLIDGTTREEWLDEFEKA